MPVIKSAKKKVRRDRKKTAHNKKIEGNLKSLIKLMRRNPANKALNEATSALDKAVKINLIHANKASRLKSRLSKLLNLSKNSQSSVSKKSVKNNKK